MEQFVDENNYPLFDGIVNLKKERTQGMNLFELMDVAIAERLGVDVDTYIEIVDTLSDEDMKFVIETALNSSSIEDDLNDARKFFK